MGRFNLRKVLSFGFLTFAAATLVLFGGSSSALADSHRDHHRNDHNNDNNNQPRINGSIGTTATTATIPFRFRRFRDRTVTVVISIKKDSNGMIMEKAVTAKLDGSGRGMVTVRGLMAGTDYKFKVRILKNNGNGSTDNSQTRDAMTT